MKSSTDVSSFETLFTNEEPVDSITKEVKAKTRSDRKGFFGLFGFGFSRKGGGNDTGGAGDDAVFADFAFTRRESESAGLVAAVTAADRGLPLKVDAGDEEKAEAGLDSLG